MNSVEIKQILSECCNDLLFVYKGKKAIITSTVENYVPTYEVFYGENERQYANVDAVMSDKFYDGKSIIELSEEKTVEFSCV